MSTGLWTRHWAMFLQIWEAISLNDNSTISNGFGVNEWNTQTKSNPFTIPRKQSVKMPFGLSTADASCEILQARNYILIQINCFPNYTVLVRVIEGWVTFRTHIFCCIFKLHQSWKKLDGAHKKFTLHTINDIFSHVSRETWFTPNMWKTLKIKRKSSHEEKWV